MPQLHGTPWISTTPHTNFFLVQLNGISLYRDAFVLKRLPEPPSPIQGAALMSPARNPALLALGIILIELTLGQTMDAVLSPQDGVAAGDAESSLLEGYETAMRLLDKIGMMGGSNYGNAVPRCMRCHFCQASTSLEDEAMQKEVFTGVAGLLQKDLENIMA
jgi:hypothetical protein